MLVTTDLNICFPLWFIFFVKLMGKPEPKIKAHVAIF